MRNRSSGQKGYSLIELLVVLVIVGILSIASAYYLGSPKTSAVQGALSEMEGVIAHATKRSSELSGRVILVSNGLWSDGTLELKFRYPDATEEVVFSKKKMTEYSRIAWDTNNSLLATATAGAPITGVLGTAPGSFLTAANNPLFKGTANSSNFIEGNQFNQGFSIAVCGVNSNGTTYSGAPAGVLLVVGTNVYKYYKANASEPWRRL